MGHIFSVSLSCDTLISRCWDCAAGQALYTCNLEDNLADLKAATDELKERRNDVMRKVEFSEQGNMKRLDLVQGWLSRTEIIINEADQLLVGGPAQIENLCMNCCCSKNYKATLDFSKRVARKLVDVKDLNVKGVFEEVAVPVPAAPVVERPSDSAVGLESVFNKVLSRFEEKRVGIIGIYGKGGVGKTRLLTEINNKIGDSFCGFDVVIWVVVSKGFYIGKVQDDIAKRIGLLGGTWTDKAPEERAMDIFRVLKKKKFVLLLDDLWERVDLSKVGIPFPTQENGSKLMFTTRSMEVCGQMRAHEKIEVECLPEEKALELFEEHVGKDILDSHREIRELSPEVATECGGLPLALITIGRAMACKHTPEEWKFAIEVLKRSANFVFPNMGEEVYPLLKFSYDSLSSDRIRCCLLYCSLFPEDYKIEKERLIERWIGEGILDEYNSINEARNQGHHIIGSLIHACLLEEVSYRFIPSIKMHDVIRDMSLWIACSCEAEKWKFFVRAGYNLSKVPEAGKWKGIRRMSLMRNKIEHISEAPNCPHLESLFLDWNLLKVIRNDFFQYMCGLKSLSLLGNISITELPAGISKLVSLEYLDLSFTGIRQLPTELEALQKLKYLNLRNMGSSIEIPKGLISAFSALQILRMYGSCPFDGEHLNEYLFEELQCLNHLNVLTTTFTVDSALDRFLSAERLHSCTEEIGLIDLEGKQFNILSLGNMKILKLITFHGCASLEEVKTDWEGDGRMIKGPAETQISMKLTEPYFQSLREVIISSCSKLRDMTWLILAPNLVSLYVVNCEEMEEIINERKLSQVAELIGTLSPFTRLEYLVLNLLPEMKSIYCDAFPLPYMKEINVHKCPKLGRLPLKSNIAKGNKIRIVGSEMWWKELQWEDESTQDAFRSCFTAL